MTEDEEDMLDMAFELTDTSRLGCQIKVTPEMDGIVVKVPGDGFSIPHSERADAEKRSRGGGGDWA